MSRPVRIEYPNAYYHVMNRGRGRQTIFPDDAHFEIFLSTLEEACTRFSIEVHAYCLMTNHYHLLVKTPLGNLQRAMRHIGGVYTQRYNRLNNTDGALFRGRYKAILIDSDPYLLHLSKYIHLNPKQAGMVDQLELYPWSSFPAYIGQQNTPTWLKTQEVYDQLTEKRAIKKKYQAFVENEALRADVESFYSNLRSPPVFGDQPFVEAIESYIDDSNFELSRTERKFNQLSIELIVREVADQLDCDKETLVKAVKGRGARNTPRKVAMYLAQQLGDHRLTEIANYFGLNHYGGVSSAISDIKQRIQGDQKLRDEINSIIKRFDP